MRNAPFGAYGFSFSSFVVIFSPDIVAYSLIMVLLCLAPRAAIGEMLVTEAFCMIST